MTLEDTYRDYLRALNDRRLDDLVSFVHDQLTYNDRPMSRDQYAASIASDVDAAPDLFYDARIVVAAGNRLACRLLFARTPRRPFLGLEPTGRSVSFAEHVFYDFRDDRIAAVTSLIDRDTVRKQLGA
ncbi:ester cyclase [Actinoplanes sp. M2I2]|uniref:ester cyclase n=1 Tax=Actinoplanes sp. M2I2 TaxID=1734444 RepID=UPI0020216AE9|nr:ester cyclase [Actinoplanes sp. M2I2]